MANLKGKKILITAGPTREYLDPVRYISNDSSGKMGYALAEAASRAGAGVTLISGPTNLSRPKCSKFIQVVSAREMYTKVMKEFPKADVIICAAAVADFRPKNIFKGKIKKGRARLGSSPRLRKYGVLELVENPDILKDLGKRKFKNQILIGFALETKNLIANAKRKLAEKKCDMIIANLNDVIGRDSASVLILKGCGYIKKLENMAKKEIAGRILRELTSAPL